jgi:hypothetical protein
VTEAERAVWECEVSKLLLLLTQSAPIGGAAAVMNIDLMPIIREAHRRDTKP